MSRVAFEDLDAGTVYDVGGFTADRAEMIAFAERYDPQPIHTDPDAAAESIFGGIIASGWYTAACCMRLLVDEFFNTAISMGSFGMDELRWDTPVRPGDSITVEMAIVDTASSESRDDRGYITVDVTATTQRGEEVVYWQATNIIGTR